MQRSDVDNTNTSKSEHVFKDHLVMVRYDADASLSTQLHVTRHTSPVTGVDLNQVQRTELLL